MAERIDPENGVGWGHPRDWKSEENTGSASPSNQLFLVSKLLQISQYFRSQKTTYTYR